ncbi:E3 ubiquitin-protein ligase Topors isoform 1-T1 [Discoglossus pictus]
MREKKSRRRRAGAREEAPHPMMASSTEDFSVDGSFSPKAGTSKLQSHGAPADASPDSKCPICLDRFDNVSHLDRCLHRFCFRCIQEWAKNKAECPLCKQPFHSIFHSVRAEDDFKEYVLRPTVNGSFASSDGHRFRYRTTMTRDYRLPIYPLRSSSTQRTFSPPDNGILFEGISSQASQQRDGDIHQMLRRLATRRQASAEGRSMRQIQEQELINFRRALYRSGVRVRSIQDGGRYRDISAEFFRRNPACLHRLIPWLKRELTVLFGTHGSLVNIVQHIIMSNVTRYDMESQAFVEDLRPFLLHRTDHFLHEFINFARCPYNIEAYDQHANYDCPAPSYEEGSNSESSVITISPDEVASREPDVPSALGVGQAPWDDETPGPSYSTSEQATAAVSPTLNISESSDEEPSSSQDIAQDDIKIDSAENTTDKATPVDDCVIVGFVKPLAERTPELVELSSDSEISLCEVKTEDAKKPMLKPFTLLSDSNESSRSSTPSSSFSNDKHAHKSRHKAHTSSGRHKKKEKGKRPVDLPSKNTKESRKDKGSVHSCHDVSRWRARSRSSDCYSRSSRNRSHNNRRRRHSRNILKTRTPEKGRHKGWRETRRSRSRDRSLSWRSRTVSLTSESSRERGRSSSRSQNHIRGRSRSQDSDHNFAADNYRSTYQWEYTYYSKNRDRDGYEQFYRRRTRGRGYYARPSGSPEYNIQSYSARRDTRRERGYCTSKHNDRYRSRSRSSSPMNISGIERTRSDKPGGKRKYKTRHLETQEKEAIDQENHDSKGKEVGKSSPGRHTGGCKNELVGSSSTEPKQKWRKKARSPSVEIVYEGKAAEGTRHHKKKKKKKHKKKRRREPTVSSPPASPIIITIDSDSETPMVEDIPSNEINTFLPDKNLSTESTIPLTSQSPATSATASTTDLLSGEGADQDSKGYDVCSSNGHLDAATGILDGLHFDDSSDEQVLTATCSPPISPSPTHEVAAPAETPLTESEPAMNNASPVTSSVTDQLQHSLAESSNESNYLENMA